MSNEAKPCSGFDGINEKGHVGVEHVSPRIDIVHPPIPGEVYPDTTVGFNRIIF